MLETIREYGLERLAEAGDGDRVAGRARERTSWHWPRRPTRTCAGRTSWTGWPGWPPSGTTCSAALHSAIDAGDAATAVRLAAALSMYWMMLGDHNSAAAWLRQALDVPGEASPLARTTAMAAYLINSGIWNPRNERHGTLADEVLASVRALGSDRSHPVLWLVEPMVKMFTDDTAGGLAAVDRGLSQADPWSRAMLRLLRSFILENGGDAAGRRAELVEAAGMFREIGDRWGLGTALGGLAEVQNSLGDFDAAATTLEESMRLMREVGAEEDATNAQVWLAGIWARKGDVDRARSELRALLEQRSRDRSPVSASVDPVVAGRAGPTYRRPRRSGSAVPCGAAQRGRFAAGGAAFQRHARNLADVPGDRGG